ncbi:MAG: thiol:disulfide interchange protein DsbA/DsbL [Dechloromonas sp.]|nr:thiol:disulfide interchange protein DsbA/DsbL [Dechloromonas sp.]
MKFARRSFVGAALVAAAAFALPVAAQVAGKDYTPITPAQPTEDAAKIEVLEFFGYFCPHCRDANPLLSAWAAKQPSDVVVKKVPVSFGRQQLVPWQRLYYTLEATGDLARLDSSAYKAAQDDRLPLVSEDVAADWAAQNGVDRKKFLDAWKSFSVQSKVQRAGQLERLYKVAGVPALAVEGKYMVGEMSFSDKLLVADKLIAKSRSEKPGKK